MSDDFYGAFDREILCDDSNPPRKSDYRSVFHQDRDRLMFTPTFRRLQAKTQVFQAGEYDFYRTRLTHSLEVSRIAESIAIFLRVAHPKCRSISNCWNPFASRTTSATRPSATPASACSTKSWARNTAASRASAQTLRILTRTIYSGQNRAHRA